MLGSPAIVRDASVPKHLLVAITKFDRDRQPEWPVVPLDAVAIPPVSAGVLDILIQHEVIRSSHHVKPAPPGDVVRLADGDAGHRTASIISLSFQRLSGGGYTT